MSRRALTFDLDDVVFHSKDAIIKFLSARGIAPNFSDFAYRWLPDDVRQELFGYFAMPDFYKTVPTSPNLPMYIETLRKDYDVLFVTARPKSLSWATLQQFADGGIGVEEKEIIFLGLGADKTEALKRIAPILHIDDGAPVIEACLANGINHLMVSNEFTGYNHYLRDEPKVRWVKNLDEFWESRDYFINYQANCDK